MADLRQTNYLAGYPASLTARVHGLIREERLAGWLLDKYPRAHEVRNDKALYDYVFGIKQVHLRNAGQLGRVAYDSKLHVIRNALGMHTLVTHVHGARLKTRRELRVATLFRNMPEAFLRMIVVHELAHMREVNHDKAFYQLCEHMEPDYAQLEFEVRAYLTYLDADGPELWGAVAL